MTDWRSRIERWLVCSWHGHRPRQRFDHRWYCTRCGKMVR